MKIKPLDIKPLLKSPVIIAIVGDTDSGKSNLVYAMIEQIKARTEGTNIYTYGLRSNIAGITEITSLEELELIEHSVVFLDEFWFLFGLEEERKTTSRRFSGHFNSSAIGKTSSSLLACRTTLTSFWVRLSTSQFSSDVPSRI